MTGPTEYARFYKKKKISLSIAHSLTFLNTLLLLLPYYLLNFIIFTLVKIEMNNK